MASATYDETATLPPGSIKTDVAPSEAIELSTLKRVDLDDFLATAAATSEGAQAVVESQPPPDPTPVVIKNERLLVAAICWFLFIWGWSDGTLGPLLPRIQETHNLSYTTVSMLFIANCVGTVTGSFSIMYLEDRFGMGKVLVLMGVIQSVAFALLAAGLPFPVMCIAYAMNGYAISISGSQPQSFVASFPKDTSVQFGILHSTYGLGAFISPLVSTQFAKHKKWNYHYLISDVICIIGIFIAAAVFKFKRKEYFIPVVQANNESNTTNARTSNKYKAMLALRVVHYAAFMLLVYVGSEVSIGGWIVTYLQKRRSAGPSAGYVSSGFFAGLMLGRILLLPVTKKLGRKIVVYIYTVSVIGLQLTVWFVPSFLENAVAVGFVGFLLGPIFPVTIGQLADMVPTWLLPGIVGWVMAISQIGGALFPFTTGALANKYGVQASQPLIIALLLTQIALWFFVTHAKSFKVQ